MAKTNQEESKPKEKPSKLTEFIPELLNLNDGIHLPPQIDNGSIISNHKIAIPLQFHSQHHNAFPTIALKPNNDQVHGEVKVPEHELDSQMPIGLKRNGRSKVLKIPKSVNTGSVNGLIPAPNPRHNKSLCRLTPKFMKLVKEAEDHTLDLNKTADDLEVPKRRVYDIVNVMEGIGLLEKSSKNHMRWKGYSECGSTELNDHDATTLKSEVESLGAEERRLDESIREKNKLLRALVEDENNKRHLFVTENDITNLPRFQNQMLIALKPTQPSYLEVPDPDQGIGSPQYKLTVKSYSSPVDLYLISQQRVESEGLLLNQEQNQSNIPEIQRPLLSKSSGIQKIIPPECHVDDDYWFRSDCEVSIAQLWGSN